ncbi:TPA: alkyl hydroperoxide reductase [Elizabethkingia anophelis]
MKLFKCLLLLIVSLKLQAQQINMNFPKFAGKNYDFIIFQGSHQKTLIQGIIPPDGKFTLSIPNEYMPYSGMSRWLITGTKEGGGLDLFIPGHNFSVSCKSNQPSEKNIIYQDNFGNTELNNLYRAQEKILGRYELMKQAKYLYSSSDDNYSVFSNEYNSQVKAFIRFQETLTKKGDYISEFIRIVNITTGIGTKLHDREEDKAENIADYISNDLSWKILYTSGHWWSIIHSWVNIHTRVLKDPNRFATDFKKINEKLKSENLQTDFKSLVLSFLKEEPNMEYTRGISSTL